MNKSPYDIIIAPHLSEKADRLNSEENQYCFKVRLDANKIEIKKAIEEIFDVRVAAVRTQVIRGKIKRYGRTYGKRPNWKKAIVQLVEGDSIDLFEA